LPSVDDCPECNGSREDFRSSKRQCHDDRSRRTISRDNCEEKRVPIHGRLGGRVKVQDRLEDEANNLVPDERPFSHEIEHQRNYRYDPEAYPQWCPGGLTKSQTRRVQRLHHQEQEKERPQGEEQVRSQSVALLALLSLYELIRKFTDTDVAFTK
jgi:hypothetical protein